MFVSSSDGVQVAVFDLGGSAREHLLISHATGFHGPAYTPLADALAARFNSISFDFRGHGVTVTPSVGLRPPDGGRLDWRRYGDDAVAVARSVRQRTDGALVGFGHSMGGAALLMAAHRDPSLFRLLVLFEPIVYPQQQEGPTERQSMITEVARRRRRTFDSYDAAIANFAAKPPLEAFPPDALEAYVRHGFAPGEDGKVHLRCSPETEAATFEGSGGHDTWDLLPFIDLPVLVLAGKADEIGPAVFAPQVAERLPNGRFEEHPELDHFGPLTHPGEVAALVADFADSVD